MDTDFARIETIEEIKKNLGGREKEIQWEKVMELFDRDTEYIEGSRMDALLEAILPIPETDPEDPGVIGLDQVYNYVMELRRRCFAVAVALLSMFEIDQKQTDALKTIEEVKDLIQESGVFQILPIQKKPDSSVSQLKEVNPSIPQPA